MLLGNINIVEGYREHKVLPYAAAVKQLVKQRRKKDK